MGATIRRQYKTQYSIKHRPGKSMSHVDALSRNPLPSCLLVTECEEGVLARLRKAQKEDDEVKRIFETVEQEEPNGYMLRGRVVGFRLVVVCFQDGSTIRRKT